MNNASYLKCLISLFCCVVFSIPSTSESAQVILENQIASPSKALQIIVSQAAQELRADTPLARTDEQWKKLQQTSDYFNAKKLSDAVYIRQKLISEEGFKEVTFQSEDGHKIAGLLRIKDKAPYTVVNFSGFFPGRKEGMATLVELFDRNINLMLVDARGHGQSEGPFASALLSGEYGLDEHLDVIAALKYVSEKTNGNPIIVHGLCMGGRHATIALAHMSSTIDPETQLSLTARYNIRGFISDSAPTGAAILKPVLREEVVNKMLPQIIKTKFPRFFGGGLPKQEILKTKTFKVMAVIASGFVRIGRFIIESNGLNLNDWSGAIKSKGKVKHITCPIMYIHPVCDTYVPFSCTKNISQEAKEKTEFYPTQHIEHVTMHIQHPKEYAQEIDMFIQKVLDKELVKQPSPSLSRHVTSRDLSRDFSSAVFSFILGCV